MSEEIKEGDRVMTPTGHAGEVCAIVGRNVEVRTINGTKTYNKAFLTPIGRDADQSHTDLPARSVCDADQSHTDLEINVTPLSHRALDSEYQPYEWTTGGACSECKQPFEGMHLVSKTTCSGKCRKRRERRQKEAYAAHIMVLHELAKIRDSLKRRENIGEFIPQLQRLKGEINDLLLLAGDREALEKQQMLYDRSRRMS